MPLQVGSSSGSYQLVAPLGAGGMGEVYRGRDTRLNREVALKLLPSAFSADPDRLARVARGAQTLALLNHANIAQIYGLEETATGQVLVMEWSTGKRLRTGWRVPPAAGFPWRKLYPSPARSPTRSRPLTTAASSTAI